MIFVKFENLLISYVFLQVIFLWKGFFLLWFFSSYPRKVTSHLKDPWRKRFLLEISNCTCIMFPAFLWGSHICSCAIAILTLWKKPCSSLSSDCVSHSYPLKIRCAYYLEILVPVSCFGLFLILLHHIPFV